MKLNELLNKRADKTLWSMAPCEICDAPTRWVLSPYCHRCEWLIAYWRGGVVDHESAFGDLPPETALVGDSALLDDSVLPFFNTRGFCVDRIREPRLIPWWAAQSVAAHWSTVAVRDFDWRYSEQNEPEKISKLERSINEKD